MTKKADTDYRARIPREIWEPLKKRAKANYRKLQDEIIAVLDRDIKAAKK